MHDTRSEQDLAWRLWSLLLELEGFLWDRYESEFIERHLAEEEQRWSIKSDGLQDDVLPF